MGGGMGGRLNGLDVPKADVPAEKSKSKGRMTATSPHSLAKRSYGGEHSGPWCAILVVQKSPPIIPTRSFLALMMPIPLRFFSRPPVSHAVRWSLNVLSIKLDQ